MQVLELQFARSCAHCEGTASSQQQVKTKFRPLRIARFENFPKTQNYLTTLPNLLIKFEEHRHNPRVRRSYVDSYPELTE